MLKRANRTGSPVRQRTTAGLVSAFLASVALPGYALAQSASSAAPANAPARIAFDIPAQDLNRAVLNFAQRAGVRVFYDTAKLGGRRSSAVSGTLTAPEALGRLLAGTGLTYRFSNPQQVTILDPNAGGATVGSAPAGAVELETIDVQTAPDGSVGYVATRSTAGTKTDTPLIETPQSISVVTREELDDRNVQTLTQAVAYTPGVRTESSGFDPRFDAFTIRGFDVTYNGIYRDGLRLPGANMSIFKVEPYGVQNVTVLRGPSSALYGLGSPGGLVDITSKRPQEDPFGEVELQLGNFESIQGNIDIGGKLDKDGEWLYRLTGVVRDAETANVQGGGVNDIVNIAPALTWKPNDRTTLTILGEYQESETPSAFPWYAWTGTAGKPVSWADPDYNSQKQTQYRIGYLFEHEIDNVFTARQNLRYAHADTEVRYTGLAGINDEGTIASRYTGYVHDILDSFVVDNQVQADFMTGAVEHKLLVGFDYNYLALDSGIGYGSAPDLDLITGQSLGAFVDPPFNYSRSNQTQNQFGLYVQEQAKYDRWILTLTGRQDWVDTQTDDLLNNSKESADDSEFTYRAGLTYMFDNGIAPYVSYSTSFAPNLGVGPDGKAFVPTTAEQIEAGVKYAPKGFDGFFTASVFQITQTGGIVSINYISEQRGEVRGRGAELEAVANIGAGLRVRAAYTYLDLKTITGDPDTIGKVPLAAPRNSFAVWGDYTVQEGYALAGLGLGLGVRYTGSTYGDATNSFKNDAVTLVDAAANYDLERISPNLKGWHAQLNAQNLFDKDYVTCEAGYCYQGTRRTVIGSLKYRW